MMPDTGPMQYDPKHGWRKLVVPDPPRPPREPVIKDGSFLQMWIGCLFWLESMVIGGAVFGGILDPFFIVGATALNFFVIAPTVAFLYAAAIKMLWPD